MPEIQVLPQNVADQIAAGEVAERPSAVVKELVENAMDAGARHIHVEIKKGGIAYIRVTDDGCGIPADQIETAFLRHATSKLTAISDLEQIATMGFRGEALASICAVAEVEVISKTKDAAEGCCLTVQHGNARDKQPIACADGTTMLVQKLFANVPARMKFLKKDATEAGYVADVLSRIALSHPDISFSYTSDEKEVFSTAGDGSLQNAVLKIYGLDHAKATIPVDYTEDQIHITGLIGKPELARGNRTRQTLFVNGRYVKNHVIAKVAEEAFRNAIMVGRFPFFIISVHLPQNMVDVNVHPAKTEVKFANEKQIYDVAYHAIRNALYRTNAEQAEETTPVQNRTAENHAVPGAAASVPKHGAVTGFPKQGGRVDPGLVRQYMAYTIPKQQDRPGLEDTQKQEDAAQPEPAIRANVFCEPKPGDAAPAQPIEPAAPPRPVEPVQAALFDMEETASPEEHTRIIGQAFDTYIICQKGDSIFLIDQHAAHERLRFEQLRTAYLNRERMAQMRMTPAVLNLDFQEKQTVWEHRAEFLKFGFEIEDFGMGSVIVHAAPIAADEETIRDLVLELGEAMQQQRRHPVADFEERALDMISCKYAIKANHHLSMAEMQDLVRRTEAMETSGVKTCPHGRPVRVTLTKAEIEKMFKRRV